MTLTAQIPNLWLDDDQSGEIVPCNAEQTDAIGIRWFCTLGRGHSDRKHVAHYENYEDDRNENDPFTHNRVGLIWEATP